MALSVVHIERWVEVEEDSGVWEGLVNDVLERMDEVCTNNSEIPSDANNRQNICGSGDKFEEIPSPVDVQKAFEELENLAQPTRLMKAADGLHIAKRAFIDAFGENNKKRKKQATVCMIHEFFPN